MNNVFIRTLSLLAVALLGSVRAQVPQLLNYQGRIAVEGVNFDSTAAGHAGQFKFALVDGSAPPAVYWSNDGSIDGQTTANAPLAAVSLKVSKGLYAVLLGDTSLANMTAIPASVFSSHADVRLRVWFDDGIKGFQLLAPDERIASVGYAIMAGSAVVAQTVPDGSITAAKLADGAVGSAKLAPGFAINGTVPTGFGLALLGGADAAAGRAALALGSVALQDATAITATGNAPRFRLTDGVAGAQAGLHLYTDALDHQRTAALFGNNLTLNAAGTPLRPDLTRDGAGLLMETNVTAAGQVANEYGFIDQDGRRPFALHWRPGEDLGALALTVPLALSLDAANAASDAAFGVSAAVAAPGLATMYVRNTDAGGSKGAQLVLGEKDGNSGWSLINDLSADGTGEFVLRQRSGNRFPLMVDPAGRIGLGHDFGESWSDPVDIKGALRAGHLKLVPQAAPANPAEGWLYADTATHSLYFYNGTSWTQPYTSAANVLGAILGADGLGSGLDADLVRGTVPSVLGLALLGGADAAAGRMALGVPSADSPAFTTGSTLTGAQPGQFFTENVGGHSASVSLVANPDDPAHRFLMVGNNVKASTAPGFAFAPIEGGAGNLGWGFGLENNFTTAGGFSQHEFYLMDSGSARPFQLGWAQQEGGIVTNIVAGVVTCGHSHGLVAGKQFQFPTLVGAGGVSTLTDYFVSASGLTDTQFRFSATYGGTENDGNAASGTWQRGGYGVSLLLVPTYIIVGDYTDARYGTVTFGVQNTKASTPAMLLIENTGTAAGKHAILQMGYPGATVEYDPAGTSADDFSITTVNHNVLWKDQSGHIGLGIGRLDGVTLGAQVEVGGQFAVTAGTAPAPTYTFHGDLDTGFYAVEADQIGVATGGSLAAKFGHNFLEFYGTGTAARFSPGYAGIDYANFAVTQPKLIFTAGANLAGGSPGSGALTISSTGVAIGGGTEIASSGATGAALLTAGTADAARTALGLGSLATQDSTAIKLIPQVAPANPAEGWIYADSTTHGLAYYNGTAWTQPYTSPAALLAALQGVAGTGSGLDADLVRGTTPSPFGLALLATADAGATRTALGLGPVATVPGMPGALGLTLLGTAEAPAARTALGLGSVVTQDAQAVAISGGAITGLSTLGISTGALPADSPVSLASTWSAAAVAFTALKIDITDTASAAGSLLQDWQVGGASQFSVRKDGALLGPANTTELALEAGGSGRLSYGGTPIASWNQTAGWMLGSGLPVNWDNDLLLGRDAAATLQLGADAAVPIPQTIKAQDGAGTDKEGADMTLAGGTGTGTGKGGAVRTATAIGGVTGPGRGTLSTRTYQSARPTTLTGGADTTIASVTLASGRHLGGRLFVTVEAGDGTDFQVHSAVLVFSAVNKGGAILANISAEGSATDAFTAGTLTASWTIVQNGAAVEIKCNVTSSLTQPALACKWIADLNSNDPAVVTPQ